MFYSPAILLRVLRQFQGENDSDALHRFTETPLLERKRREEEQEVDENFDFFGGRKSGGGSGRLSHTVGGRTSGRTSGRISNSRGVMM